jgi:arylsulfatase A-like enzyme
VAPAPTTVHGASSVVVLGRVGVAGEPTALSVPALKSAKVELGHRTRDAIRADPDGSFRVHVPPGSERIMLSIGARDRTPGSSVQFSVSARVAAEWQPIFSERLVADTAVWLDRTVELPGATPPEELRFECQASGPEGPWPEAYWGSIVFLGSAPTDASHATGGAGRRPLPNVILISLDTLGAEYLNAPGVSPHLDAILERAFSFRRAYAHYPNTLVSHASLFTGLYPNHHGVYGGGTHARLRSDTLAAALARHRYFTVAFTENAYVSSDFGFDYGFSWYDNGTPDPSGTVYGDAAGTFAKATRWLEQHGDARFFLFVHTYEVHTPYTPRDPEARRVVAAMNPGYGGRFRQRYPGGDLEVAHNSGEKPIAKDDLGQLRALYTGEIAYLDRLVGDFLDRLAARPDADRTLIVLTADHGDEFGDRGKIGHGETLSDAVLHVPLGFLWPDTIATGVSDQRVGLVDVAPTVLDLVGIDRPQHLDGQSLAPVLLRERPQVAPRPVFAELRMARGSCRQEGLPDDCAIERYSVQTERFKFVSSLIPRYEALYDLERDPQQRHNIADRYPDEVRRHRELLATYANASLGPRRATPPSSMSDETRKRLRALGYID